MGKFRYKILAKFDNDFEHEFDVKVKRTKKGNDKFRLKRSNSPEWTVPREKLNKIKDDGEGMIIDGKHYEYHEFKELFLLMSTVIKHQSEQWADFKIKKDVDNK